GLELFFLGTGEKADISAKRHDRTGDEQLLELVLPDRQMEPRDEREQSLSGPCPSDERHEADGRVEEEVERDPLLEVARRDPEQIVAGEGERADHALARRGAAGLARDAAADRGPLGARAVAQ